MELYLENNFLNMEGILRDPHPFIVVIGARGTGKTYGTLKACVENGIRFMYLRRTARILELIMDPALHIFKRLNADQSWEIRPELSKSLGRFYNDQRSGELIGYAAALSTFANIRGFDGSDIDVLIYDEFIPEPTERQTFNSYTALLNAAETIGRNRELEGRPPLKMLLLSNSDLIYSDIIAGLKIGDMLYQMQEESREVYDVSPDLLLIRPASEAFAEEKAKTALYRLTSGQSYAAVALENRFPIEDRDRIKERPLREYIPLAEISGICIYRHKSNGTLYVTDRVSGTPAHYENNEAERRRFLRNHPSVWRLFQKKKVYFSGIDVQTRFKSIYE